jgi:hypothetical protein
MVTETLTLPSLDVPVAEYVPSAYVDDVVEVEVVEVATGVAVAEAPTTTIDVLVGSAVVVAALELGLATAAVLSRVDATATLCAAGWLDSRPAR